MRPSGDRTLSQLAEQFDLHPNAQLEEGAADVFGPGGGSGNAQPTGDVKSLHAKIGELTRPSKRSTYRRGKVVQTTGTSSDRAVERDHRQRAAHHVRGAVEQKIGYDAFWLAAETASGRILPAWTMLTIAADPNRLGAHIGITAVLHTWGSTMTHHPHVHIIVPDGRVSLNGKQRV